MTPESSNLHDRSSENFKFRILNVFLISLRPFKQASMIQRQSWGWTSTVSATSVKYSLVYYTGFQSVSLTVCSRMTVWQWVINWKPYCRKWPWPNLRYWPEMCTKRLSKTTKYLSETRRTSRQDLYSQIPDYKAELPTILLQIVVALY